MARPWACPPADVPGLALGLDVGTTGVKALLIDATGEVHARGSSHHGIAARPGVVETRPHDWWSSVCRALERLGPSVRDVTAAGVTGNMSSVVLLDERLEPLLDAPLLADARGQDEIDALPPELAQRITQRTFNRPAAVFSLATLLWLRDQRPELLAAGRAWMSAKDYVRLRLTGTVATDVTDAYNSLLIAAGQTDWDFELIRALDLPRAVFPEIAPSTAVTGAVSAAAATETGLREGTPVVVGAGDMAAAMVGAGASAPGDVLVSLGTSATALAALPAPTDPPPWLGALTYHPLPQPGRGFALASLLTGGLAVNWLRDGLGIEPTLLGPPTGPAADDPLVFLPHLSGTGTPDFDPHVHGSLLGLRPSTTRNDVVAALFEAIAFELADAIDRLDPGPDLRVVLTGGGTRLRGWAQIIADGLERPVEIDEQPDASALGAARLAAAGASAENGTAMLEDRRPQAICTLTPRTARRERRERYRAARALARTYYDSTTERRER